MEKAKGIKGILLKMTGLRPPRVNPMKSRTRGLNKISCSNFLFEGTQKRRGPLPTIITPIHRDAMCGA